MIDDAPGLILEVVEHGDLYEQRDKLNPNIIHVIMKKIILAFNYCNSERIVHTDIKSENILLKNIFEPIIIDFGTSIILLFQMN